MKKSLFALALLAVASSVMALAHGPPESMTSNSLHGGIDNIISSAPMSAAVARNANGGGAGCILASDTCSDCRTAMAIGGGSGDIRSGRIPEGYGLVPEGDGLAMLASVTVPGAHPNERMLN